MRDAYHEELDAMSGTLADMATLVRTAMARATTALLGADLSLAENVIAADNAVDEAQRGLDERALSLLARQQPVASDLRRVITSLRMSADLERMGDLARHVALLARLRFPQPAIPDDLRETVREMASVAEKIVAKLGDALATYDVRTALELDEDDDDMDLLHRRLLQSMITGDWPHGAETAADVALCGRYYERFADHAVSVARRIVFLATGEYPSRQLGASPA